MKNTKNIALALATCSVIALGAVSANAEETLSIPATLTISNSFHLVEAGPLNFGSIAIHNDAQAGGTAGTLTMNPLATPTFTASAPGASDVDYIRALGLGGQTAGSFTIDSAAPSVVVYITLPSADVTLSCAACLGGNPDLILNTFTTNAASSRVTTSAAGAAAFLVGGRLNTVPGATQAYEDGVYVGSYDVTAAY